MKPMPTRKVRSALTSNGCTFITSDGRHEKWGCPCGKHVCAVTQHRETTAGVVRSIIQQMPCLPKGWLQ